MFKIDPNPTFEVRVAGFVPGRPTDGLTVKYRYQNGEQFQAWLQSFADKTVEDLLLDIIDGWRDAPREFSREALQDVCKAYPAFATALIDAYRGELFEAKRKNS
jgi:hypothetical protein